MRTNNLLYVSLLTILGIIGLLLPTPSWATGQTYNPFTQNLDLCLKISETDGSPSNYICGDLKVSDGTLTDNGDGTFTITTVPTLDTSEETIRGVAFTDEISALPLAVNMTSSSPLDYEHHAGAIITTTGIGSDVNFTIPNPTVYADSSYQEIYRVSNTDTEGDYYVGIEFASEQIFYLHDTAYTANWRLKSKDKGAVIVAYAIADKTYIVVPESGVWIEESF